MEPRNTYLFVTKPKYAPEEVTPESPGRWSCSSTTRRGDTAFVYVAEGTGIAHEWRVTSDAERDDEWVYMCDVEYVADFDPPITIQELREKIPQKVWAPPHTGMRGFRSIELDEEVVRRIRALRASPSTAVTLS